MKAEILPPPRLAGAPRAGPVFAAGAAGRTTCSAAAPTWPASSCGSASAAAAVARAEAAFAPPGRRTASGPRRSSPCCLSGHSRCVSASSQYMSEI